MDDPRELLVCARYEFRRGEPVEKSYKNFCDVVGNDAMEYRDFEFWWYRFKEGNFDLDYDRIKNPSKELGDMPIDIMEEIFEKLEWKERAICRKVSRNVRNLIDNVKLTIKEISYDSSDNSISLLFNCEVYIEYRETDSGYRAEFLRNSKIINGADFRQMAYADLKAILNNPKLQIDFFIVLMDVSPENRNAAMSEFLSFLSSLGHQLNVKSLTLSVKCQEEVLTILPYFKPRVLKEIYFCQYQIGPVMTPQLKIDRIVELEQWKKAKRLLSQVIITDSKIEHFLHFHLFAIHIDAISKEDAIRLKNTILASPDFEFCRLKVESNKSYEEVIEIFGEGRISIPGSTSSIHVHYWNHFVSLTKIF